MYKYFFLTLIATLLLSCDQPKSTDKGSSATVGKSVDKAPTLSIEKTPQIVNNESSPVSSGSNQNIVASKDELEKAKQEMEQIADKGSNKVDGVDKKTSDKLETFADKLASKSDSKVKEDKNRTPELTEKKAKSNDTVKPTISKSAGNKPTITKPDEEKDVDQTTTRPSAPVVSKPTISEDTMAEVQDHVAQDTKPEKPRQAQSKPMHSFFNYVLLTYVSDQGKVNYEGILSEIDKLDKYTMDLQNFPPKDDWGKNEKLAYWINAYNAFTIKLICDNYPVASIKDLHGGKPWDHKWIELDGKTLSLNDIENGIIRPTFKEPRIHFAVNCAAKSCPPLANEAFTKTNLDVLLEKRTKSFINNSAYNDLTKNPAMVSKIFDWYKEDFGDVVTFINKYVYDGVKPISAIDYTEYDWALNN